MANRCCFCEEVRPEGGTNHLILNLDGKKDVWLEFCKPCGDKETLSNSDGSRYTITQVVERIRENII